MKILYKPKGNDARSVVKICDRTAMLALKYRLVSNVYQIGIKAEQRYTDTTEFYNFIVDVVPHFMVIKLFQLEHVYTT